MPAPNNPHRRTLPGSEVELLPVELAMQRAQLSDLDRICKFLEMDRQQIIRWALVDFARKPALDALFQRQARPVLPGEEESCED